MTFTTTYPEDLKTEIEFLVYAAATRLGDNQVDASYWRPVIDRLAMEEEWMTTVKEFNGTEENVIQKWIPRELVDKMR